MDREKLIDLIMHYGRMCDNYRAEGGEYNGREKIKALDDVITFIENNIPYSPTRKERNAHVR